MFYVEGGVYEDTTWTKIQPGTFEQHGPFPTREAAHDEWKARVWLNVDNALHRLKIVER